MRKSLEAIVLALFVCGCGFSTPSSSSRSLAPPPTVEEYIRKEVALVDASIPKSAGLKKIIEDVHPGVDYRGGSVRTMRVITRDGSQSAGYDGSNVSEVILDLFLRWEGPFTRDGFTELRIVYNVREKSVVETTYLRSNALINLATVDWVQVGILVAMML